MQRTRLERLRRHLGFLLGVVLVGLLAAGCGNATAAAPSGPIRIVDDLGQTITLSHPADRLVVLEPSNFEIVDALGLRKDIVGIDSSIPTYTPAPWRAATRGLPSIGPSYPGITVERIVAARPQVVLATTGISGLKGLTALHIPVVVLNPQNIQGVYHDIALVGAITGHRAAAAALVAHMRAQVQHWTAVARRAPTRPTVFYDLGGLFTAGPHNFVNSLIQLAGGVNIGARLSSQAFPQVTAEQVVAANPDIILIDPDATTVAKERQIPGFLDTRAGKSGHIEAVFNSAYINEPSPGLVLGLKELIELLHPGLIKTGR